MNSTHNEPSKSLTRTHCRLESLSLPGAGTVLVLFDMKLSATRNEWVAWSYASLEVIAVITDNSGEWEAIGIEGQVLNLPDLEKIYPLSEALIH